MQYHDGPRPACGGHRGASSVVVYLQLSDREMNGMLQLTADERDWLAKYRQTLRTVFPGQIEEIVIFGSKARVDADPDSDVDVLIVLREGDRKTRWQVLDLGHELAGASDALPSIPLSGRSDVPRAAETPPARRWCARLRGSRPGDRSRLRRAPQQLICISGTTVRRRRALPRDADPVTRAPAIRRERSARPGRDAVDVIRS